MRPVASFAGQRPSPLLRRLAVLGLLVALIEATFTEPDSLAAQDQRDRGLGVTTLTGSVSVTNPFLFEIITEPYILLSDLSNFVGRDVDGDLPDFVQVTGQLEGDLATATYSLPLPILPQATINDVDNGEPGDGLQIYSVDLSANFIGDPFIQPEEGGGWASEYTSVGTAIGTNEITGGKLVIWSPDLEQSFPSGFGDDGLLFTDDDPVAGVEPGWTVVDLDEAEFDFIRDSSVEVDILEGDGGLKDLSDLGYVEAFDALVEEMRLRYPFTAYKDLDWDAIVDEIRPRVERAEATGDARLFQVAMMRFTVLIGDGHVSVSPNVDFLIEQYGAGYGISLGQTDEGEVVVTDVRSDSSAEDAGIDPGAEIITWNDEPVSRAVAEIDLLFAASSPHTTALQQLDLLTRGEPDETAEVVFQNLDADEVATTLTAEVDLDGLIEMFTPSGTVLAELPVTVEILPSGYGYIRVNTFLDDLILMTHAWDWAIGQLSDLQVPGLIVDVRGNGGGNGAVATYFAGTFYDEPFDLAAAYFADESGEFVYNGTEVVRPNGLDWDEPVAVLVDENCASACEDFAAAMAIDSDHLIVGQYATAGVMAGIYPWELPDELYFQAPLVYFEDDNGVWLEGVGVQPTVDVPVTVESLLSEDDVVLAAAEDALDES